jgi:DNA-binding winged helix-turn-helix (wHTH) protein
MASSRMSIADRSCRRRWSFAGCIFDECNWTLTVEGQRVPIETKPLELLRELLLRAGNLVTKDELLDRTWPGVTVVEASLPTAVRKLRLALGDDRRDRAIIETVAGIGYRLAVPVQAEDLSAASDGPITAGHPAAAEAIGVEVATTTGEPRTNGLPRRAAMAGALATAFIALAIALAPPEHAAANRVPRPFTQRDAANALRKGDVGAIEDMLAAGWNPNTAFDRQGNGAINYLLNKCEWDRGHDQEQMVLMVRTLIDGGARLDHRNVWGDTPYSIAKAVRYCGPNHPVTRSIRTMCYAGLKPLGDRCLASYEIDRRLGG